MFKRQSKLSNNNITLMRAKREKGRQCYDEQMEILSDQFQ